MAVNESQVVAAEGVVIDDGAIVGYAYDGWSAPARLGELCRVRAGTIIYADTDIGRGTLTGVHALVREHTVTGSDCVIGSGTIIEGHVQMGNSVVLQSGVFIPTDTVLGDRVFIGPRAVLTNDRYPLRRRREYRSQPPVLEDDVTVGANATLLPGVRVGEGAMVGAGAVVTRDVPPWTIALGTPARFKDLSPALRERNATRTRR